MLMCLLKRSRTCREVKELQERLQAVIISKGSARGGPASAYELAMERIKRMQAGPGADLRGRAHPEPASSGAVHAGGDFAALEAKLARLEKIIGCVPLMCSGFAHSSRSSARNAIWNERSVTSLRSLACEMRFVL